MRTYHLALLKGSQGFWSNGHKETTVVLQAVQDIDFLSCATWEYLGQRITTKANLHKNRTEILTWINRTFHSNFQTLIIA